MPISFKGNYPKNKIKIKRQVINLKSEKFQLFTISLAFETEADHARKKRIESSSHFMMTMMVMMMVVVMIMMVVVMMMMMMVILLMVMIMMMMMMMMRMLLDDGGCDANGKDSRSQTLKKRL